ncbi:hypothetical protein C3Y08_15405 [Burkholderia gladioli]|uniref:hypothetical protein n=1 Tax=Burkholderia gladioli TaxID=28095 RepID=UPI000CDB98A5|nr:hypothetical protein [Burkholderia gladioli]POS07328.1 hypothetical protein C3Y08_15405 [Burkholderia gladioli]
MNRELSEQERAERRQIVDEMIAAADLDTQEVAYLEAYARGELSLEEVSGRIIGRGDAKAEQVMAEAVEDAEIFLVHSEIEQQRILRKGELEAKRIREDLGGPAERLGALLRSAENPKAAVEELLLHGTAEQLALTAKYLAAAPGSSDALDETLRQLLTDMPEPELREAWLNRLRPMLIEWQMLSQEQFRKLDADVSNLLSAYQKRPGSTRAQKYVITAVVFATLVFIVRSFGWH